LNIVFGCVLRYAFYIKIGFSSASFALAKRASLGSSSLMVFFIVFFIIYYEYVFEFVNLPPLPNAPTWVSYGFFTSSSLLFISSFFYLLFSNSSS
jgi:hypothetical protein